MDKRTPEQDRLLKPGYQRLFIATMFLVCLFDFADRAVFAVLAQSIKEDLRISDFEIGLLQGLAFALLYSIVGLPIARLAERFSRRKIIAICTAIWSAATSWCGFASSFAQLAIGRIGVGMGEGGFLPAANSLVGDQFPRNRRASTMALIMLGTPAGILTGALVGGFVADLASWREAFFVLGLPGLLTAVFVWFVIKEPSRGLVDGAPPELTPPPDFRAFLGTLRRKRALIFVIAGGATAGFGMTSISQFLAVFLARVHDLDVREAAAFYGIISATFLSIGLLVGSFGTDWLAKRDARWPAWGGAIGLGVAPFVYFAAFNAESLALATTLLILAGSMLLLFYGPTSGMIQNLLEPRMRATGIASFALLYTVLGSGLGPTFVGFVSDRMAVASYAGDFFADCPGGVAPEAASAALAAACETASAAGVQRALLVAVCIFFVAAFFYYLASRTLREDLYNPDVQSSA
jgi:predicted MFS family arabinose efflux permease